MAKYSKLFHSAVAFLVVLIIGLVAAIYFQRQSIAKSQLRERIELDNRRLDALSEKARLITPHIPLLEDTASGLDSQLEAYQARLYAVSQRSEIESFLNRITRAAQLDLTALEDVTLDEKPVFREHVFNVRMTGPMRNLPVWANQFFEQPLLARIDRISIVSPDYKFQRVRFKATIRYYEGQDPSRIIPGEIDLEQLEIDLSYADKAGSEDDTAYGDALEQARNKVRDLSKLKQDLESAERLEKRIAGVNRLIEATQELARQVDVNRTTVLQNIPTLYIRVRNSAFGSAALLIQGEEARFPDISGDD